MAKVGEGDPRWLVQERSDGTNVGAWHWVEKDISAWAKTTLKTLLGETQYEDDVLSFSVKSVEKADGEASVNNRKGKTIYIFEIEVNLKWEAQLKGADKKVTGKANFTIDPDEIDDFEVEFSSDSNSADYDKARSSLRTKGVPALRSTVAKFVKQMKDEYPQASKVADMPTTQAPAPVFAPVQVQSKPAPVPAPAKTTSASKKKSLKMTVNFKAPTQMVYDSLIDPTRVSAVTASAAKIEPKVGGEFSMFSGNITGKYNKLESGKLIEQSWRTSSWPAGHFSTVTLEFSHTDSGTQITLNQEGIPDDDFDRTELGWKQRFWEPMRMLFGEVSLS